MGGFLMHLLGFLARHARVLRGGSWLNNQNNAQAVNRNNNNPQNRNNNVGFRVLRPTSLSPFNGCHTHKLLGGMRVRMVALGQRNLASKRKPIGYNRLAGCGEGIKMAQVNPVRTGERHRRAHTKPVA